MVQTVYEVTTAGAAHNPAIGAPGRPWLSYGELKKLVDDTLATLNGVGIGRDDRVAIVLPNGPEMATAFVAVAAGATSAPLNPAYRAEEFEFYLDDLKPKALIVQQGMDSPVRAVAQKLGVPIIELILAADGPAGLFTLDASALKPARRSRQARRAASTLRWCCTPRAPRRGPRSCRCRRRNLAASARHIGGDAGADADGPLPQHHAAVPHPRPDRGGAVARSSAGASVFCTPGFNALRFFAWLDEAQADLVHGRADHAPGDPGARRAQRRERQARPTAALHPLVLGVAAAAGDAGARGRPSAAR